MQHGLMGRLGGVMALCLLCALPALADAARWAALMEEAHEAAVVGYSNVLYGDWQLALRKYKAAVREVEGLGPHDPRLAETLDALGLLYLHLYMYEDETPFDCTERGKQCILRAQAVREAAFGKTNPEMVRSLGNVAHYYTHLEERTEAQDAAAAYEQALRMAEKGFGKKDPRLAQALLVLEPWYRDEPVPEGYAQPTLERALEIVEAAYGTTDARLVPFLYQIADAQVDMSDIDAAIQTYARALIIQEGAYGKEDPRLVPTLYRYGGLLQALQDENSDLFMMNGFDDEEPDVPAAPDEEDAEEIKASTLYERALAILENAYGKESVQTIPALHKLAGYQRVIGEQEAAWDLYERALGRAELHFGKDDPRTLECLLALADWAAEEDPVQAEALFTRGVAIAERADAQRDNEVVTDVYRRLARYYVADQHNEQAAVQAEKLVAFCERTPKMDADEVSDAYALLQQCYREMGDEQKTAAVLERRLAFVEKHYGPESDELLETLRELAWQYDEEEGTDRAKRAVANYTRIIAIEEKRPNKTAEMADDLQTLARAYAQADDLPQAIAALRRAQGMVEKLNGPESAEMVAINQQLAHYLQQHGEMAEVEPLLVKCVEIARKLGDPDELLGPQMALADFYRTQEQYAKAETLYVELNARMQERGGTTEMVSYLLECYRAQKKYADAEKLLQERLAEQNEERRHESMQWRMELIKLYRAWGKAAEETAAIQVVLDECKAAEGDKPRYAFYMLHTLSEEYGEAEMLTEQEALLQRMLPVIEKAYPNGAELCLILLQLAGNQMAQKKLEDAEKTIARAREHADRLEDEEEGYGRAGIEREIATVYRNHGQYAKAEAIFRHLLAEAEQNEANLYMRIHWQTEIGDVLTKQAKYAEAETLYLQVIKQFAAQKDDNEEAAYRKYQLGLFELKLAACYAGWGKAAEAETCFKNALGAIEAMNRRGGENLAQCLLAYAAFLREQKRDEEAAALEKRRKDIEDNPTTMRRRMRRPVPVVD